MGHVIPLQKWCAGPDCAALIPKDESVSWGEYAKRRYCSRACFGRATRHAAEAVERPPAVYPGAQYAARGDVPPTCPRCGGPWRWVPGGVTCYLCGRDAYVASELRAQHE